MPLDASPLDDPDEFVRGVPHALLAELREHDPVHWHGSGPGRPRYVVTSHQYVRQLNRDWQHFSSEGLTVAGGDAGARRAEPVTLLESDPPAHTVMRRLVSRGFTPRAVRVLERTAVEVANELVERFVVSGGGDAALELGAQLPLRVSGVMLGIPPEDLPQILGWTTTYIGAADPETCPSPEHASRAQRELREYGRSHIARRRADPGDDVFSTLIAARVDGVPLTDDELVGWWQLLVTGSTETTRNLLNGGLALLLDNPDQAAALADDPRLVDNAIEEVMRVVSPVMHHQRRVSARVEHETGTVFEPGDVVDLWMTAANRDETVWNDPDAFDVTRTENDHLSFGSGGPHYCLGANLARREARAFFAAIAPHVPRMRRTGPEAWLRSTSFHSLKHLPVSVGT